jgi:hypothetical protein
MKLNQKELELGIKDIEIESQKKKIEWLLQKFANSADHDLAMSDNTDLELKHKTILEQEAKLEDQKVLISELKNKNNNLNKRLKSATVKSQEDALKMDQQQKTIEELETEIRTQQNIISELQSEITNLNNQLKSTDDTDTKVDQNLSEEENLKLQSFDMEISGPSDKCDKSDKSDTNYKNGKNGKSDKCDESDKYAKNHKCDNCDQGHKGDKSDYCDKSDKGLKCDKTLIEYIECTPEIKTETTFNEDSDVEPNTSSMEDQSSNNFEDNTGIQKGKKFQCQLCPKAFTRRFDLKRHVDVVHKNIPLFKCEICSKSYGYRGKLKSHVDTVHKNLKPFKCQYCPKTFGRNWHFKRHLELVHKKMIKLG